MKCLMCEMETRVPCGIGSHWRCEKFKRRFQFLESLELSVRTTSCLKSCGVDSREKFLKLDRESSLRIPNFGKKCWNEVEHMQKVLLGLVDLRTEKKEQFAKMVNEFLESDPSLRIEIDVVTGKVRFFNADNF